jgi:WD40 repeat protein
MCLINSNTLASISANLIKIWDLRNNKSLKTIHNHEKSILTIAYDSHTKQIITAGLDSLLKFHYLNVKNEYFH